MLQLSTVRRAFVLRLKLDTDDGMGLVKSDGILLLKNGLSRFHGNQYPSEFPNEQFENWDRICFNRSDVLQSIDF
ncbi:hypothetical protein Tco_0786905 [Tanacetum coccineum]